jgi:hypothetical protein
MARVLALIPDLLFGSRVQADLTAAGHEVALLADVQAVPELSQVDLLVVDLTDDASRRAELVEGLGELGGTRTLAFYSHVDVAVRERAARAGFDLVVPRSRMAREGARLVDGLARRTV